MNYGELKSLIASEINRTDLDSFIGDAINSALNEYGTKKFRWNSDVQQTAFTAGSGALTLPPGFFSLISLKYISASNTSRVLDFRSYRDLDILDDNSTITGQPTYYAIFEDVFRIYPVPDDDYTVYVSYYRTFDLPVGNTDTHVLITNAPELVKYKAKELLYGNVLFDETSANYYGALAERELKRLQVAFSAEATPLVLSLNG